MSKTRAQLVNRALAKLNQTGAGQTPDSEDQEAMDGYVDAVINQLSGDEIYTVADDNDIDDAAFEWIADILATAAALEFRTQPSPQVREYAETRLTRLNSSDPTRQPLATDYF